MSSPMPFFGKWTFSQTDAYVQVDPATKALTVGAQPADGSEKFNAYGSATAFVLQGGNGLYVVAANGGYTASARRTDALNQFTLEAADGGSFRVLDLGLNGHGTQSLWNNANNVIVPAPTDNPPSTTEFAQTIVTPSLETIFQSGFTSSTPDLTWAYLEGTDFTQANAILDFTQSILVSADFSNTKFLEQSGFDHCLGQNVNFTNAVLTGALFGTAHLESSNFTQAQMSGADLSDAFLTGATMKGVNLRSSGNLANATFAGAHLEGADFTNSLNIYQTDFTGAYLNGAKFTGSSVTGWMKLQNADCTGAAINNPGMVTIYPNMLQVNAKTNFTQAQLQNINFTGYDLSNIIFSNANLTGCKLDGTKLLNTEFGYATLDGVTFGGGLSMQGANFSNASLKGADMTGAQMGAISLLFRVASDSPGYNTFLTALSNSDSATVTAIFKTNGITLTGTVTVTPSPFAPPNTSWLVEAVSSTVSTYTVLLEMVGQLQSLDVYQPSTPAVLSNAFMVNVNLTGANLYGVRASGVQLYATAGSSVNLNRAKLDGVQFNNGNLGNIDLSQADLPGVNFDYTILTGAKFTGAQLHVDAKGGQTSFNGSNLQGADFTASVLKNVVFTNAAVSVPSPLNAQSYAGVWLFGLTAQEATLMLPELDLASPDPAAPPTAPKHQFDLPVMLLSYLNAFGPVPQPIIAGFAKNGNIALSSSALLMILTTSIYWQVQDGDTAYVIFESCNTDYQPALGVASGSDFTTTALFWMPLSLEPQLVAGPVSSDVAAAFASAGYPLTSAATIGIRQHPTSWQVVDTSVIYSMWLNLESSLMGCGYAITARPAIQNTIAAFADVSIALSQRATIARLTSTGSLKGWRISNDAGNPYNPVTNYIEFQVFTNAANGLDVYGSIIRIIRMQSPTEEIFFNIPCSTTLLLQNLLNPDNICPNSNTVATNLANNLPYDQWMRAKYLPSPPVCVPDPDGNFNCPN